MGDLHVIPTNISPKKKLCYSFELFICIHVLSFIVDTLSLIPYTSCVCEQKPLNPLILMYFYLNQKKG